MMALVACPECGHTASTTAKACPSCGPVRPPAPVRPVMEKRFREKYSLEL